MVDDHPVFRLGLARLLQRGDQFTVAWSTSSVSQALKKLERSPVDLVLMDLHFNDGADGLDALKAVRAHWPHTKVLVVSAFADRQTAAAVKAVGAVGIVSKEAPVVELLDAIGQAVKRGTTPPSGGRLKRQGRLQPARSPARSAALANLTNRELEVLDEIRQGLTNREIALRLGVSTSTVNKHVHRVLSKLGARNRAQAAMVR